MKKRHFDVETDGFYGAYWKCKTGSDCAMIAMIGDDPEDYLARTSVKWLHKLGVNVMTMSPAKKDYGHHNYPLERIEKAISWLTVLLIGAEDDVLWDTAKYIRRMKQRMKEHSHTCRLDYVIYEHGTHFVFPESMLKTMLPVGSGLFVKLAFQAARKHPKECRRARLDIDWRVRNAVAKWKRVDR